MKEKEVSNGFWSEQLKNGYFLKWGGPCDEQVRRTDLGVCPFEILIDLEGPRGRVGVAGIMEGHSVLRGVTNTINNWYVRTSVW